MIRSYISALQGQHSNFFWLLSLLYMGGLYWLSDQPGGDRPLPFPGADKIVHLVLYSGLGGLLRLATTSVPMVLSVGFFYGVMDEFHQAFVPGRSADPWDVLADGMGVLLGCFIINRLRTP